jgi:hypothetical protein
MPFWKNCFNYREGLNGTAEKVLQLPKRGRYGRKLVSARRQCINRHAASQSPHRETLPEGQSPMRCTGFRHSACWHYTAAHRLAGFLHKK